MPSTRNKARTMRRPPLPASFASVRRSIRSVSDSSRGHVNSRKRHKLAAPPRGTAARPKRKAVREEAEGEEREGRATLLGAPVPDQYSPPPGCPAATHGPDLFRGWPPLRAHARTHEEWRARWGTAGETVRSPGKVWCCSCDLERTPLNQGIGGEHLRQFAYPNRYPGAVPQQKCKIGAGQHYGAHARAEPIEPKPGARARPGRSNA